MRSIATMKSARGGGSVVSTTPGYRVVLPGFSALVLASSTCPSRARQATTFATSPPPTSSSTPTFAGASLLSGSAWRCPRTTSTSFLSFTTTTTNTTTACLATTSPSSFTTSQQNPKDGVVPIWPVSKLTLDAQLEETFPDHPALPEFAKSAGFAGEEGQVLAVPNPSGAGLAGWLFGTGSGTNPFAFGSLPQKLPVASYRIESGSRAGVDAADEEACIGWGLGSYAFKRYKTSSPAEDEAGPADAGAPADEEEVPKLCVDDESRRRECELIVDSVFLGRDLINTPCSDLGPADLARSAERLGKAHGANVKVIKGSELERGFPLVHAVGRAASSGRDPLVVDMVWSASKRADAPLVTIVGKGVCFDTGGLDIKPPSSMLTMKKDMGGAASVLSLASMVMGAKLDVKLRVLLPCVENCVAGNAFRPSDVIHSRSGQTVEIGNTDAEGRLILADCLTLASESEQPDLLLDMATLTGAHRVALGWDLPGVFTDNDELAQEMYSAGLEHHDPVWRLPLWKPYAKMLDSKVADMNNIGSAPWGGAITAALFLQKFTNKCPNWVHIDFNGWTSAKPGFPEGGEPQAVRGIYKLLKAKYGTAA